MTETPVDLDKHRGMASQKATDIRRVLAEVEANAKLQRDRQGIALPGQLPYFNRLRGRFGGGTRFQRKRCGGQGKQAAKDEEDVTHRAGTDGRWCRALAQGEPALAQRRVRPRVHATDAMGRTLPARRYSQDKAVRTMTLRSS